MLFPTRSFEGLRIEGIWPRDLPNPFVERLESSKLHSFSFKTTQNWTPEAREEARKSFERQLEEQIDPSVKGEPHIYFPSSASECIDVTLTKVKKVSMGQELILLSSKKGTSWEIVILGAFNSPRFHAGMLPGWIGYKGWVYKLYFEEREDVCKVCGFENDSLEDCCVLDDQAVCSVCHVNIHCEYACFEPQKHVCITWPRPSEAAQDEGALL